MFTNLLNSSTGGSLWFIVILIGAMALLFVFSGTKRKKEEKIAQEFASNLKVGDKIRTYSGIYGKIIQIKETVNGKVAIIETGEGKHVSYLTVDVFSILNIEVPTQEKANSANEQVAESAEVVETAEPVEVSAVEQVEADEVKIEEDKSELEKMKKKEKKSK